MNDTPKTDEQEFNEAGNYDVDWPAFARGLEREITRLREAVIAHENITSEMLAMSDEDAAHVYNKEFAALLRAMHASSTNT